MKGPPALPNELAENGEHEMVSHDVSFGAATNPCRQLEHSFEDLPPLRRRNLDAANREDIKKAFHAIGVWLSAGSNMYSGLDYYSPIVRVGWVLLFLAVLPRSVVGQANERDPDLCWQPEELVSLPREKDIRKNIGNAYVPPPQGEPISLPRLPKTMRGAIRRVELPGDSPKLIALTFDMCEQPYEISGYDGSIVDLLRKEDVKATFFAGGKWLLTHPARAQQLMADPLFEVGNHTWEHKNLRIVSGGSLRTEIAAPQVAYEKLRSQLVARQCFTRDQRTRAADRAPKSMNLFRFPFGACNSASLDAVNDAGLLAIQWDVSSGDPSIGVLPGHMASAVLRAVKPGSIVLFHGNGRGWHTAQALTQILPRLKEQHYEFVTISELLNAPGARLDIRPICFDEKPGDADHYDDLARRLEIRFREFAAKFAPRSLVPGNTHEREIVAPVQSGTETGTMGPPERNPVFRQPPLAGRSREQ